MGDERGIRACLVPAGSPDPLRERAGPSAPQAGSVGSAWDGVLRMGLRPRLPAASHNKSPRPIGKLRWAVFFACCLLCG